MLETIKKEIQKQQNNNTDFTTFYWNYIQRVQDENINNELSYLGLYNELSIYQLDRLIEKEMVTSHDSITRSK